jgi:hypothetical protein
LEKAVANQLLLNSSKTEIHRIQVDISPKQLPEKESIDYFLEKEILNYHEIYYWRVRARISDRETIWSELWSFLTNENPWQVAGDDDDDGIPNSEEVRIHTDPAVKTLFIRPKKTIITPTGIEYIYWEKFISLFPDSRPGFARIPALADAGLEVVVIGCIGNSGKYKANCHDHSPFDNFDYDPVSESLACDILEITHEMETNEMGEGIHCAYFPKTINQVPVSGHTYLDLITQYHSAKWSPGRCFRMVLGYKRIYTMGLSTSRLFYAPDFSFSPEKLFPGRRL